MADENDYPAGEDLTSRPPSAEDLRDLCRELNTCQAKYIVIEGFAMHSAGYDRATLNVDLLIDTALENEARVYQALESLPDKAVRELKPGEVAQYAVVRVGDEILVDLMKAPTKREKDMPDLVFLRQYFAARGETPPEV